jgi:hypothetical protein
MIHDLVMTQIDYTKTKHPEFCNKFLKVTECVQHIENELAIARAQSDAEAKEGFSVQATLNEEVLEAMEAYAKGEFDHAIEELAQVAAVAIRGINFIMEYHTNG